MNKKQDWSHDIDLPEYGPYNKEYVGFSHIASKEKGLRLDIDVLPGFFRRSCMDTRTITDCGARMWRARPDLKRFVYRYEMLAPNRIYCETDFSQKGKNGEIVCTFVNDTDLPQSVHADFCFSVRVPTYYHIPSVACEVSVPEGSVWVPAGDYSSQQGFDGITHDGFRLGEKCEPYAVKGCAVFAKEGKKVKLNYKFAEIEADRLLLRYRSAENGKICVNGNEIILVPCDSLTTVCIPIPNKMYTELCIQAENAVVIDGFAIGCDAEKTVFEPWPEVFVPQITRTENGMKLKYPLIDTEYTVSWDAEKYVVRELIGENDGDILTRNIHDHVNLRLSGSGRGHYTDLFVRPVFLQPHEKKKFTIRILAGGEPSPVKKLSLPEFTVNPCGKTYVPSMDRLAATTALNVVYPNYYRGSYIRSYTPGRYWDCYYTWDCGMIAVGMAALDREKAFEILKAYLMPQEDMQSPFLHHGTPLLTQMFIFKELLDAGETEKCRTAYPALKFAFDYFLTLPKCGGLIPTWRLFYNSAGWDDYPAQKYVHLHELESNTSAVTITALMRVFASIMKTAAKLLGFEYDCGHYDEVRDLLAEGIKPCWDEETGYFGYGTCDENGSFTGIMRDKDGINPNQGLDGLYPMISGVCTSSQKKRMLDNVKNGLFTKYGVSVVDTRSPYFLDSGYWNGSIWMPHQWILWKGLLDMGETALAHKIASTALKLWKKETDVSGNTYEHFMLETGRGAGFHHFSGLSSPVLSWFKAYYVPGSVTAGFDTAVIRQEWKEDCTGLKLEIETHFDHAALIVTMKEGGEYKLGSTSADVTMTKLHAGTYCLKKRKKGRAEIIIERN